MIVQPLTKSGNKVVTQTSTPSSNPRIVAPITKAPSQPTPTPTRATNQPTKSATVVSQQPKTFIQQAQSSFDNLIKGVKASFVPKVVSPIPDSQVIKPTVPDKPISIIPGQKYLAPKQLQRALPQTTAAIKDLSAPQKVDIKKAASDAWTAIKEPFIEEMKRIQENAIPTKSIAERNAKQLKVYTGAANVALSPVSAIFAVLNNSTLQTATKAIAVPFVLAGESASKISDSIIDTLPLSDKTKATLKPAFAEAASLAAQIALGEIINIGTKRAKVTIDRVGADTFEKFTKNVIEESGSPKTVNLNPEQMQSVLTGKLSKYETDLVKNLGLKSTEWRKAVKEGLTIEIPAEKITRIIDKPYWEKIKSTLGIDPTNITKVTSGTPTTRTGFAGYLTDGTYSPEQLLGKVVGSPFEKTPEGKAAVKLALDAQQQGMDISIQKAADESLLTSEIAKQKAIEDTPQAKQARAELQTKQQAIEQAKQENQVKKSILEQFDTSTIRAMRNIKRSVASLESKGLDPTNVSKTESYKNNIESVMEALGTTSEDVALNYIRNDLPDALTSASTRNELEQIRVLKSKIIPKEVSVPRSQLPVGEGKPKASKLEARMKGVIGEATPEQIDQLGLSMSNTAKNDQQLSDAAKYVTDYPQEALDVVLGKKDAPPGLLRNAVYAAMTKQAKFDATLATKLTGQVSKRFGQENQILSQLDPNSPVKLLNEVYEVREEAFKKKYGNRPLKEIREKVVKQIKETVKKPDKYDWNNFISALEC